MPDGLAVAADGTVWVALAHGGRVAVFSPEGEEVRSIPVPLPMVTSVCFGGPDLRTAFITLSHSGRLVSCVWPEAGLPLHYLNERAG